MHRATGCAWLLGKQWNPCSRSVPPWIWRRVTYPDHRPHGQIGAVMVEQLVGARWPVRDALRTVWAHRPTRLKWRQLCICCVLNTEEVNVLVLSKALICICCVLNTENPVYAVCWIQERYIYIYILLCANSYELYAWIDEPTGKMCYCCISCTLGKPFYHLRMAETHCSF